MTMRRASSGFTMIELMLALAIFALITTIMFGSFAQTASSKRVIQSEQERTHAVRVALMRMSREIEMAYLSDNENTAIANRRTLFVGSARVDVDAFHVQLPGRKPALRENARSLGGCRDNVILAPAAALEVYECQPKG